MSNLKKISEFPTETLAGTQKFLVEQSDGTYANVLGSDLSGGGGSQDLQSVTNIGATTTNSMSVYNSSNGDLGDVTANYIMSWNSITYKQAALTSGGALYLNNGHSNGDASSYLQNTNVTSSNVVTLEFPNKATNSYTIATTDDLVGHITHAVASGTDTYTATIAGVTAYNDGDAYCIRFTNANTDTSTLNINSLGAVTLYRNNDGAIIGGDIWAGGDMLCIYNSTLGGFQCIGTSPNSLFAYVTNADSVTINKGEPVYAFGSTGNRMSVKLAYNTTDATSAQTYGLVYSTSIAANQKGIIIIQGTLTGLNLGGTWVDGDPVYLGATAGSKTRTKPYAPNHLVYLGVVERANAGNGIMYVRIQNGYEMDELHNVSAQSPSLNDGLFYNTSTSLWETKSIATVLGYTPQAQLTSGTNIKTVNGTSLLGSGDLGIITGTYGGTGVNNGTKTITLGGNLTTTGAFNTTFSVPATATYTLPSATSTLLANNLGITGGSTWISGTAAADKATIQSTSNATHTAGKNIFKFKKNGSADATTSVAFSIGDGDNGVSNDRVQFWALNNSAANDYFLHAGASFSYFNATTDLRLLIANTAVLNVSSSTVTMVQGMTVSDGKNIVLNTTTGTKIGTATTQKLSFWNATPIVQPTTAVAAATFVANSGTAVNDASTFGGYTLKQVVQALQNIGLLA